jgi:L-fuculose-phosphate aldolase
MKSKAHFIDRVSREMEEDLKASSSSVEANLAACCRILASEGHESGLAGQVTARAKKPGTFWTLQFGYGFEEATAKRMVLVDDDLKPLKGGRPNPGVRFHVWIYNKRPDVQAIVHTHAPHASALASTGKPLKTIHMDSAMLHGTAHLPEWPGVPVADDEGRIISGALGRSAKTILLANHGLLAAGASVEEATYLAVFFERAARMQLRAMAAGGFKEVKPELAEEARDFLLQPSIVRGTFAYWARRSSGT